MFYFYHYFFYFVNAKKLQNCGVDYIFTEFTFEVFKYYVNIYIFISAVAEHIIFYLAFILPFIVKTLIGYCHFYYQLGYGVLFYIYIFRRYNAKKKRKWQHFYGKSTINWVLFNLSFYNKFITNKNLIIFIKTLLVSTPPIINFLITRWLVLAKFFRQLKKISYYCFKNIVNYTWTPIFKRSSYISLLTFLKRFNKRK